MRIGVIGCGRWGRNHAATLSGLSVLAGVADLVPERREALASELGSVATTTQALLQDPTINAVVIALPPAEQAEVALSALAAGKHLLVEKPMALDAARAAQIASRAKAAGVVAMTGHLLLFHPAWRAIKRIVAEGALGELCHIRTVRAGQGRFYPGTDVAWDLMPHDLSLVRDLMGALPMDGHMVATPVVSDRLADIVSVQGAFPDGPSLDLFVSRVAPKKVRRVLVQGSRASLLWDEGEEWSKRLCLTPNPHHGDLEVTSRYLPLDEKQSLTEQLVQFINTIEGKVTARGTVFGGVDVLHFIQRIHPDQGSATRAQQLAVASL